MPRGGLSALTLAESAAALGRPPSCIRVSTSIVRKWGRSPLLFAPAAPLDARAPNAAGRRMLHAEERGFGGDTDPRKFYKYSCLYSPPRWARGVSNSAAIHLQG